MLEKPVFGEYFGTGVVTVPIYPQNTVFEGFESLLYNGLPT
jgi:hypothetical protein